MSLIPRSPRHLAARGGSLLVVMKLRLQLLHLRVRLLMVLVPGREQPGALLAQLGPLGVLIGTPPPAIPCQSPSPIV